MEKLALQVPTCLPSPPQPQPLSGCRPPSRWASLPSLQAQSWPRRSPPCYLPICSNPTVSWVQLCSGHPHRPSVRWTELEVIIPAACPWTSRIPSSSLSFLISPTCRRGPGGWSWWEADGGCSQGAAPGTAPAPVPCPFKKLCLSLSLSRRLLPLMSWCDPDTLGFPFQTVL